MMIFTSWDDLIGKTVKSVKIYYNDNANEIQCSYEWVLIEFESGIIIQEFDNVWYEGGDVGLIDEINQHMPHELKALINQYKQLT